MNDLEKLLPLLEPEALGRFASKKARDAGQELFDNRAVSDLVVADGGVKGRVKGTRATPYSTGLIPKKKRDGLHLEGHCTCPTFSDGWEQVCHHAVALALELRRQYRQGAELTQTENPWVASSRGAQRRYQLEPRRGVWRVRVFEAGSSERGRKGRESLSPADRAIETFLEMEVDETDDGAHVLEDHAVAGLLYFARDHSVSVKGMGRLKFSDEPLSLRVQAENKEAESLVELHAFLEDEDGRRSFEVEEGRVIVGAPSWFLWPETSELFSVPGTPPWVLEAVAKQGRIRMDSRVGAEQMDGLSDSLQSVGVPRSDLFALASDSRAIDEIILTVEGDATRLKIGLSARYDNVTLRIGGEDPESARYAIEIDGQGLAFYRDLDGEAKARTILRDAGARWSEASEAFVADDDAAVEFIVAGLPMLPESWQKRIPQLPKLRTKSPSPKISVRSKRGSVLEVEATVEIEGETDLISFRDLLRWLHEGRRWITLSDGSVAKLDPKILEPIAEASGNIDFDKKGTAELTTLDLGTLNRLLTAAPSADVARDVKKLMANMTGEKAARAPRKAKALTAKLREYQRSGFAWLWQLHENGMTGILADDMGLGKTVQALALLTKAKETDGDMPSLIVAPTSVLGVWRAEAKKWAPSLSVLIWHGTDRAENRRMLKKVDVVVTSYALLRRDIEQLSKIRFRYAILDEAQYIKNWTTSTAKSAKELKCDHRLALSGTPVENHLVDLWAIFDFLAPGFLGKLGEFQKTYVRPIEDGDKASLEALRARVRPFIMRRRKEDVASELPPKTEQTLYVHFGRSQLSLYNKILKAARKEIDLKIGEKGLDKSQMTVLAALTRLRQVCTDPQLLNLPEGQTVPPSAKLEAFKELIADSVGSGRRALVFSQFVEMQKILCKALEEMDIDYLWLHGGTKNRDELVETFQREDGPPVFLISLKAGGSGLTLTQADTVIHYDPWWNPAVEDQATDRAHRIGQEKPVMVYRLVVEHTVEQKMVELGQDKRAAAETALGRDTTMGKKLTMDDVERLLETPIGGAAAWE